MKYCLIILLLSSCSPIREQAQLVGFKGNKSILVIDERGGDTVFYGQCNKGKVGERYWIYWRNQNKISRIKKLQ